MSERPGLRRAVLAALLTVALAIGIRDLSRSWYFPLEPQQLDLRVFYCAGRAAAAGANPYALEPIRTCEHASPSRLLMRSPNLALPFVLPGWDLPPLELLARLPFDAAARVFTACVLAALLAAIVLVVRTLRIDAVVAIAALTLSAGFPSVLLGQTATFALLAIVAAGFALATGRDRLAGILAATTLVEPHVGMFVVVAVAVLVPRARLSLGAGVAALVAVALVAGSPREQLTYLTTYLPQHAFAELHSDEQESLAYALALDGVPDRAALALGAASTLLLLIASVPLAGACARGGQRAAIAFVPAACAVIGGTFVHVTQESLAVPAALLLVRIAPTRRVAVLAGAGLALLSVAWQYPATAKQLLVLSLLAVAIAVRHAGGRLRTVFGAVAVCWLVLFYAENHPPETAAIPVERRWPADTPIAVEWRDAIAQETLFDAFRLGVKLPTWCGLLCVLGATLLVARGEDQTTLTVGPSAAAG